jgi:transketolase
MKGMQATRDAYGEALAELGEKHRNIVVLDADLSKSTKTCLFAERFPERFFNMGVAEQDMMNTAAGFAVSGKIVFCSTFAIFASLRALDQVRNTIAFSNLNVRIAASHGGLSVGPDGSSHQSIEDIGIMRGIANMRVISPADGMETKKAITESVKHEGPFYFRLGRPKFPIIFDDSYNFRLGKAVTVKEGDDVALLGTGLMLHKAIEAAGILKKDGIKAEVVNVSTIKPLDTKKILELAGRMKAIITCEEHSIYNGLGSAVAEVLAEEGVSIPFRRIGLKDVFGQSGDPEELLRIYGMDSGAIARTAKKLLNV